MCYVFYFVVCSFWVYFSSDNTIILWRRNENPTPASSIFADEEEENKESWSVYKILRFVLGVQSVYHMTVR